MLSSDRIVWITGASSGIGEALAYTYSARGARLVLSARQEKRLEEVRARCARPETHIVFPLDLADGQNLPRLGARVFDLVDHIDVLINCGGVTQRSRAVDTALEVDRRIMETNFFGAVTLTKLVLPGMIARGSGRIVAISSLMGKFGSPLRSGYCASKHALHGFFDALRAEVHDQGISVTVACPGFIRTPISLQALTGDGTPHGVMDAKQAAGIDPRVCAERIVRAAEAGKAEVFIAGTEVFGVYLKRFAPALLNRIIRRVQVT